MGTLELEQWLMTLKPWIAEGSQKDLLAIESFLLQDATELTQIMHKHLTPKQAIKENF